MASKANHYQNNSINERRLRPIYDCLDNGNNKKALQEAEKVLRKQKEFQCAKVLKCLALLRLGRYNESIKLLNEVHSELPVDDSTLQAMTICYREMNKIDLIADAYENAIKKDPTNEELLSHLFMAYVRLGHYKKQQQTAMSLYKLKPKNPYYFWSIMSLYMQAITSSDEALSKKMLLPLAQKMTKKFINEDKVEAEAEVELYLMILEKQEKYEEMLKIMEGPLGLLLPSYLDFFSRRKAFLYLKMFFYHEAFEGFKSLIENNIDQLEYYIELFNVAFILDSENMKKSESKVEEHLYMEKVIDLIDKIFLNLEKGKILEKTKNLEKNENNESLKAQITRGPYIARIELLEILKKKSSAENSYQTLIQRIDSSFVNLLVQFFNIFGHKSACFYDMSYIFSKYKIKNSEICSIIDKIKTLIDLDNYPSNVDELYRHICFLQLNFFAGLFFKLSKLEKSSLISKLIDNYDYSLKFGGDLQNHFYPTDHYIFIISYLLMDENLIEDVSLLFNLLVILERALTKSPSNFFIKLCLLKLYNLIGASGVSFSFYESLDIKHLQQDSLGYLITESLETAGHFSTAFNVINNASKFYIANYKDTYDYLISCYKYGSFTKIEEIMRLKEKLNHSIQFLLVESEKYFINLVLETKNHENFCNSLVVVDLNLEKIDPRYNKVCDNRDISIFRSINTKITEKIERNKLISFQQNVKWIKLRSLLLRTLITAYYASSQTSSKVEDENITANGIDSEKNYISIFHQLLNQLNEFHNSLKNDEIILDQFPLQGPQPSRLNLYLSQDLLKIILILFEQLESFYNYSKENTFLLHNQALDLFQSQLKKLTLTLISNLTFAGFRTLFEKAVNLVETFCFSSILIGIMYSMLKVNLNTFRKLRKKNIKNSIDLNTIVDQFNLILNGFEQSGKELTHFFKEADSGKTFLVQIDYNRFSNKGYFLLNEQETKITHQNVTEKIDKSYKQSFKELADIVTVKLKYLQHFKL